MDRRPDSHKGENGKLAIIGGSRFQHGAPLFSALAAEAGGSDLLYVCLPQLHAHVARGTSLNFQVHPFAGDELEQRDIPGMLELLATVDCAVIGPGLARDADTLNAARALIESAPCPLVLDATALQPWTLESIKGRNCIITPHLGELERMGITSKEIGDKAQEYKTVILAKGISDRVAAVDGRVTEIGGGNAGLTVGGTGDALAGLTASLLAQGMPAEEACKAASRTIKKAGAALAETHRFAYTARDVIARIPETLFSLLHTGG